MGVWMLGVLLAGCSGRVDLSGTVVGIADGDTLTVLTADRQPIKVRLAEIDAPEKWQAFGERSIHPATIKKA